VKITIDEAFISEATDQKKAREVLLHVENFDIKNSEKKKNNRRGFRRPSKTKYYSSALKIWARR